MEFPFEVEEIKKRTYKELINNSALNLEINKSFVENNLSNVQNNNNSGNQINNNFKNFSQLD